MTKTFSKSDSQRDDLQQRGQVWLHKGNDCVRAQQYEEALVAYEQALRLEPDSKVAYDGKGEILLAMYPYIPPRRREK